MTVSQNSFGSIVVDDIGISRRVWLGIRTAFQMSWEELESFAVTEAAVASIDTGKDELICQTLELQGPRGPEEVDRHATGDLLDALVAYLRLRCPEKEKHAGKESDMGESLLSG